MRREPHPNGSDERLAIGGSFLQHIEHFAPVQDAQMRTVACAILEVGDRHTGKSLQRRLPGVARTELIRAEAQPVGSVLRVVRYEPRLFECREQLVDSRSRQLEVL